MDRIKTVLDNPVITAFDSVVFVLTGPEPVDNLIFFILAGSIGTLKPSTGPVTEMYFELIIDWSDVLLKSSYSPDTNLSKIICILLIEHFSSSASISHVLMKSAE